MTPVTFLPIPEDRITELCRRNRLRNAELFGSALRQDFCPDSTALGRIGPSARTAIWTNLGF